MYETGAVGSPGEAQRVVAEAQRVLSGGAFGQVSFDEVLDHHRSHWGRTACYALSAAFFEARFRNVTTGTRRPPKLLLNLLNGGLHAYSLPVTSDFTEFLLVPRHDDPVAAIDGYRRLLADARAALTGFPLREVGGNPVHDLGLDPNEAALSLVTTLLERAGLAETFGIMIDASAGDWLDSDKYALPVSGARLDRDELIGHWLDLVARFDIVLLEDPLAETDIDGWAAFHAVRPSRCGLLSDNFTSTSPAQLAAKATHVDGVLLKPDQIGSLTGAHRFASLARELGLPLIASARSVETGSPLISHVAAAWDLDYLKVGPYQDFSSVMRTNELLRGRVL
ncbi:enolase C-terminal domain-like protein [Streptomyces sp. CBMA152]|uniref:enolase C-terminal domain-like protein n=1 Tax=Streptomyces sp. CBMA152 TaxID=1896312 RepID=UPI001661094B|nr:enolase C-terminal domain-like protein [Streptomyces sp. CBMA152]MBD0742700.1 hypothetical protein [Streptomyces sp. CBMA152]